MNDAMRIRELEHALEQAIDHMRKMPLNPITASVIRDSVKALEGGDPHAAYTSAKYTPAGLMVLGAVMSARGLTVTTGDAHMNVQQRHKDLLYEKLVEGYTIPLPERVQPDAYVHPALAPFVSGIAGGWAR